MFRKFLPKSEFLRNVGTLATGTAIAQVIALTATPILTRLFSPDDFAVYALYISVVSIIGVIATCRYELAIVLPDNDEDAKNVISLSLIISLIIGIATLGGIIIYDFILSRENKSDHFSKWFYLIPVSVFLTGAYAVFNYWSIRKKTFFMNSKGRIVNSTVNSSVGIGFGIINFSAPGLIISFVLGQFVGLLSIAKEIILNPCIFFKSVTIRNVKTAGQEYKNFALINSPHALVDSLQENGLFLLLANCFVFSITGFYSLAFRLLKAPAGLISASFYQVLFQRMAEDKNNNKNLQPLILKVYRNMFLFGFIPFLILFLFSPQLFEFIFGLNWKESGEIAKIITPWIFLNFIVTPVSSLPLIYGKQKQAFLITIIDISLRFTAIIIGGINKNFELAFILLSTSCSFVMIFAMIWYYKLAKNIDFA